MIRLRQGLRALFAFSQSVDTATAARTLTPGQLQLWQQLTRSEQLHSLRVLADVQQQGDLSQQLARAALLHDIGKIRYRLAIWQRTIAVLIKSLLPRLDAYLSRDEALTFFRAPSVVRRYHPAWSGQLLTEIESHPTTIWLATHHADNPNTWRDHPLYKDLIRLQSADDAN